jgi:hypothetical protein
MYAFLTWESIRAAWNLTLRGKEISYGANVYFYWYEQDFLQYFVPWFGASQAERILKIGPIVLAFLLIVTAAVLGLKNSRAAVASSERNLAAFRMGASIYVGTFLLGNNWDYRLAFLILVVPQLVEWTRSLPREYRYAAWASLFALLASCWHFILWYSPFLNSFPNAKEVWFVIDEILNWALVFGLAYLLFASFPDWLKQPVQSVFSAGQSSHREASEQAA